MNQPLAKETTDISPPVTRVGVVGWIRENLFSSPFNSVLTILVLLLLWQTVPPFFEWAFIKSNWFASAQDCKDCEGACWSVVTQNLRFIFFGFYPYEEQWRPMTAIGLFLILLGFTWHKRFWKKPLAYAWMAGVPAIWALMSGGIFGLMPIEMAQWGGLPLTFFVAAISILGAYPLGVILALGRQSKMPFIRIVSVIYIELVRGVPLITLLFMSAMMFPLFFPEGVTVNKILRAQLALIIFSSAYIAEVVRGGMQGIPKGQYEAAKALGLSYYQMMRLIILPQALKIVIPPTVSILIVAFKDTSLLVIIALYDLLKTTESVLANPDWMAYSTEAYIFLALLYFGCCYVMAGFSRKIERELG